MKIYFCAPIIFGRENIDLYRQLIEILQGFGQVLTVTIADTRHSDQEDAQPLDNDGNPVTHEYIYRRDVGWMQDADIAVAEVSSPSIGVGYEIAFAEKLGKPVLCLFRKGSGKRPSPMIAGNPNVKFVKYENLEEAKQIIGEFIKDAKK